MKRWTVVLLVIGALLGVMLLPGLIRARAYDRICLQAARLQDAVRHEAGLGDVCIVPDSTAVYGVVISCKRQLPPADKARLEHLFHEYFSRIPAQQVDKMLEISYVLQNLDLSPTLSPSQKSSP